MLVDHWLIERLATDWCNMWARYKRSTLLLAQGVLRRNFRLDLIEGSFLKQRISIRRANSAQPYLSTSWFRSCSSVIPCNGS